MSDLHLLSTIEISCSPCLIKYIDFNDWNLFLIGSYSLLTKNDDDIPKSVNENLVEKLESIDERIGKLTLVKNELKIHEIDCDNGGIFDFEILEKENWVEVYCAHSNGNICIYKIFQSLDVFKIVDLITLKTKSNFLISIAISFQDKVEYIFAGDDKSCINIFYNREYFSKFETKVDLPSPVWCLSFIKLSFYSGILILGTDDGHFKIIHLFDKILNKRKEILNNKEQVGVTTIYYKKGNNGHYQLFVGTFDHIYIYDLKVLIFNDLSVEVLLKKLNTVTTGAWKIKNVVNEIHLISGMYFGSSLLELKDNKDSFILEKITSESSLNNNSLIYDTCMNKNKDRLLVLSYNDKKIFCFSIGGNLFNKLNPIKVN